MFKELLEKTQKMNEEMGTNTTWRDLGWNELPQFVDADYNVYVEPLDDVDPSSRGGDINIGEIIGVDETGVTFDLDGNDTYATIEELLQGVNFKLLDAEYNVINLREIKQEEFNL